MSAEDKIREGAQAYLEEGEEILAAFVARPRGWTQTNAGSIHFGAGQQGKSISAAEAAGFELASPMALAVTRDRLLSLELGAAMKGYGAGQVKGLKSAVPLSDVSSIQRKRLLVGSVVKLTVRGQEFKLEAGTGANIKGVIEAYEGSKATA